MKYHTQYIKLFYRYLSELLLPVFIKLKISANSISISRIFLAIFGGLLLISNNFVLNLLSCVCIFLFSFFDALDGSVASKTQKSYLGLWVDPLFDRLGLLIIFSCISVKFFLQNEHLIIFFPFLNLFFYFQRSLIGSDIRTKEKFIKFKEFYSIREKDNKSTHTINNLKKSPSLKNILSLIFHQFSPHTHNQFLYLIFFILFQKLVIGLTFLMLFNFIWYLYESYKVTKISIDLDKEEKL